MTPKEFRNQLKSRGLGPGSRWSRADFHIHLPTSHDYQYKNPDAYEKLGAALEAADLRFAVLLKHETYATKAELLELKRYCPSVTLIPGVEINVFVDALSKKIGKDYFFHCIVASDPEDPDEFGHVLRRVKDRLQYTEGPYPSGFRSTIVDVAHAFRESGALFIPAHLHQAKSPEESRSIDDLYEDEAFLGFVKSGAFDALEVRQKKTATFFTGGKQTTSGIVIPRSTCVWSSDAHHHEGVGHRSTWLAVERYSFDELKAALALPHRTALVDPRITHAHVVGIHVMGSFIKEVWLQLNDGLNALIGGKGSGKTALLECLRFVLNTPIPKERLEDVQRHRNHILGTSGYVECLVRDVQGDEFVIIRRADSTDRITVIPSKGDSVAISATDRQPFPISILGWHEIESVAESASARIGILDRAGDPDSINTAYGQIRSHIGHARDLLPMLQRQARRLDQSLKEYWELKRKRDTLQKLSEDKLSVLQEQYDWFLKVEERLNSIQERASSRTSQVSDLVPSRIDADIPIAPQTPPEDLRLALGTVATSAAESLAAESRAVSDLQGALHAWRDASKSASAILSEAFRAFREGVYAPAVAQLAPADREILTKQIQILEETKRLSSVESTCNERLEELRALARQLHALCDSVCVMRDQMATTRAQLVTSLNTELIGVKLEFRGLANTDSRQRFQASYPADGALLIGFLDGHPGAHAYEKLRALFAKLQEVDLDQAKWKLEHALIEAKFVDVLDIVDDDDVGIFLEVGKRGPVEINSLSAGQRCVAVFPLLLRNNRGPLVIDQPEDNLDNRYIADTIGPDLLHKKLGQQYLVTSHNANLVVLTDADLILHVDSDGNQSSFPAAGFLACSTSNVRDSVLGVLDGGEVALLARQQKYGIGGA